MVSFEEAELRTPRRLPFARPEARISRLQDLRQNWWEYLLAAVVGAVIGFVLVSSPWPVGATLKHWAAAPNCTAAWTVGLPRAHKGQPGYYPRHDADGDGIACEVMPGSFRR